MRISLGESLRRVVRNKYPYQIRIILNGVRSSTEQDRDVAAAFRALLAFSCVSELQLIDSTTLGKIPAVNSAILDPCASGVVVADDDILVPAQALTEIESFLAAKRQMFRALCFPKAPVFDGTRSTPFNSQLRFLLHPAMQRLLLHCGFLQPSRPSGSLYAIHHTHLEPFPDPSNEADILAASNIKTSCHFARTWYPETFEAEVVRRRFHMLARRSGGPIWEKPIERIDTYAQLDLSAKALPAHVLARIHLSLETMKSVITAAAQEVTHADS
jgi:hypothetical protein